MREYIYIKLLGEGTDVYRPVPAQKIKNDLYKLEGENIYVPDDEEWEFLPGNTVVVHENELEGELALVAIKNYSE